MRIPITEHLARYLDDLPFRMEDLAARAGGGLHTWYRVRRQRAGTLFDNSVTMLAKGLGVTEEELLRIAMGPLAAGPEPNAIPVGPLYRVPIYGFANGATGLDLTGDVVPDNEHILDRASTTNPRAIAAFQVAGQSMEGDGIFDGSLVLCERVTDPKDIPNGAIVVAKVDDDLYCKHWRRIGDTILLTSSSPGGRDLELRESEPAWVLRAVEVTRKL